MACRSAQIELIYRAYNEAGGSCCNYGRAARGVARRRCRSFCTTRHIDSEEPQTEQDEHLEELENDENPDSETEEIVPVDESWTLPVRVKPVLALNGEEVVEFPLNETLDGRKNTSLVLNDDLLRIYRGIL